MLDNGVAILNIVSNMPYITFTFNLSAAFT